MSGAASSETASSEKAGARPVSLTAPQYPVTSDAPLPLDAFRDEQTVRQIRIEQRVIVRISPRRSRTQNELLAQLPRQSLNRRYEERKMEKCVPVSSIAGVQTGSGNRLLLFMRDAGIVSVNLEKACRAREFYSGFYVEKNADGQICVDRDKLQSRSGAKCEVQRMRQLVAVQE
ncbi:hypothetical protein [Erythrobacter sp. THAF29]|uniref:hypothetical protein n=1 Tax=Erythrobacter sp. THAF29 TaxID=2587851 RepID=UPI001F2A1D45|nr:hypothetical protein [Erythrobacter sp. THAF29]